MTTHRNRKELPFEEFNKLFTQLREATKTSQIDAMRLVGYEGSAISAWRDKNVVPIVAMNAIKWVLHNLDQIIDNPQPKIIFSFEELADLFALTREWHIPEETRRFLLKKIAAMLATE